jgi:IclR family transcriptional regulator, pca regulon regulatory protein
VPAHVVTPGYVILSTWADEAIDRWIAEHEFTSYGAAAMREGARFREAVLGARAQDYWVTEQLLDPGLRGIAVPLRDRRGECMGSLSMTMPIQPLSREQMVARLLPLLQETAQALRPLL